MEFSWPISSSKRWCCECTALHMPANLEDWAMARGLEKVSFHSNPKERQCKECSYYNLIVHVSHTCKVLLKIPQDSLQQNVNHELPDVQAGHTKDRGTWDLVANTCWVIKKAWEHHKCYLLLFDYVKEFDCVDHIKTLNILQKMGLLDHVTASQ